MDRLDRIERARRGGWSGRSRGGFTLVELLVAVGVVAILTLGIGQIFGSVSKLVGTGAAVVEVQQMARTVEAQLRDDFEALSRMREDETFFAIRNTRLGDLDFDDQLDADEVDLYLTAEDDEADLREDVDPYDSESRAVTTRLDEMMFIGASAGYASFQGGEALESAPHALISYGHALRPPLAEDESDDGGDPPRRLNYADGYFGAEISSDGNRFHPSGDGPTQGRNRYASDFVLSRHSLALYGPSALGYEDPNSPAPLGADTEVAMLVRDLESDQSFYRTLLGIDPDDVVQSPLGGPTWRKSLVPGRAYWSVSKWRLIRHGRVDLCVMELGDVQRWLEGGLGAGTFSGFPYERGLPSELGDLGFTGIRRPLWIRDRVPGSVLAPDAYKGNLRGLQSAIAGMFSRKLVETEPPEFRIDPASYSVPRPDPRDRRMDVHAMLAEHCIGFEIAWSDGSTWDGGSTGIEVLQADTDGDGDFEREIMPGERIWFDMDFTFADFWAELSGADLKKESAYPRPNPDPELGLLADRHFDVLPVPNDGLGTDRSHDIALNLMGDTDGFARGAYSTKYTQSVGDDAASLSGEYLAIWGFNPLSGYNRDLQAGGGSGPVGSVVGDFEGDVAWTKPRLIRVRVTLQDSQSRLERGKTFEYVLTTDLE